MAPQPPAQGGRVEGTATAVRVDAEGGRSVLRFVLRLEDGRFVPVEMRGHEVRGVLTEGDRVAVSGYRPGATLRPGAVDNLTTASQVEVWSPSGLQRLLGHGELRTAALSALVTSGIGIGVGWLQSESGPNAVDPGPTPPPPAGDDGSLWPWILGGAVTVVALAVIAVVLLRRRRSQAAAERRVEVPESSPPAPSSAVPPPAPRARRGVGRHVAAVAAGVALGLLVLALLL